MVVGLGDYLTVEDLAVTLAYLLPLSIGAWYLSRFLGVVFAVAGAATYCVAEVLEGGHTDLSLIVDTATQAAVFTYVALLLSGLKGHVEGERHARAVAEEALTNVRRLSDLLPMCSSCRKICHEPDGSWEPLEIYLLKHSDTQVSHGICPDCMAKLYPEQLRRLQAKRAKGHE
jgi:hypothetical protein